MISEEEFNAQRAKFDALEAALRSKKTIMSEAKTDLQYPIIFRHRTQHLFSKLEADVALSISHRTPRPLMQGEKEKLVQLLEAGDAAWAKRMDTNREWKRAMKEVNAFFQKQEDPATKFEVDYMAPVYWNRMRLFMKYAKQLEKDGFEGRNVSSEPGSVVDWYNTFKQAKEHIEETANFLDCFRSLDEKVWRLLACHKVYVMKGWEALEEQINKTGWYAEVQGSNDPETAMLRAMGKDGREFMTALDHFRWLMEFTKDPHGLLPSIALHKEYLAKFGLGEDKVYFTFVR